MSKATQDKQWSGQELADGHSQHLPSPLTLQVRTPFTSGKKEMTYIRKIEVFKSLIFSDVPRDISPGQSRPGLGDRLLCQETRQRVLIASSPGPEDWASESISAREAGSPRSHKPAAVPFKRKHLSQGNLGRAMYYPRCKRHDS